jgi:hypothetical protein
MELSIVINPSIAGFSAAPGVNKLKPEVLMFWLEIPPDYSTCLGVYSAALHRYALRCILLTDCRPEVVDAVNTCCDMQEQLRMPHRADHVKVRVGPIRYHHRQELWLK